jgi:hypothetical protein
MTNSEVFFLISSVGFVVLWILVAIFLVYLIRGMKTLSRIIDNSEKDIEKMGDISREMLEEIHHSSIFHFLFGKKRRKK